MSDSFLFKYCGKDQPWDNRDYDMGLWLAERASLDALGHAFDVTPYLICRRCADEIRLENPS